MDASHWLSTDVQTLITPYLRDHTPISSAEQVCPSFIHQCNVTNIQYRHLHENYANLKQYQGPSERSAPTWWYSHGQIFQKRNHNASTPRYIPISAVPMDIGMKLVINSISMLSARRNRRSSWRSRGFETSECDFPCGAPACALPYWARVTFSRALIMGSLCHMWVYALPFWVMKGSWDELGPWYLEMDGLKDQCAPAWWD